MGTDLQLKREEFENTGIELKALASKWEEAKEAASAEEITRYDDLESQHEKLKAEIATLERAERAKGLTVKPAVAAPHIVKSNKNLITRADTDKALRAFLTAGKDCYKEDYGYAAQKCGFNYGGGSFNIQLKSNSQLIERQQSLTDGEGGYGVNEAVVSGFEKALKAYWNWADLCTVRRTPTGAPYAILTNDDTSNVGAYNSELVAVSNVSTTFNRKELLAYKLTSGIFPISNELLEDSSEDIASLVSYNLGQRLARKLAKEITEGDGGSGHIRGFVNDVTQGVSTFYSNWIEYPDLVNLYFDCPEPYRNSPNAAFMMHSSVLAHLVGLQDADARPVFQAMSGGIQEAPRMTILGKPIVVNDELSTTFTPGSTLVYFGDFSKVNVRIVRDVNIRTSNEKYFLEDAVATIATMRVDSLLVDAGVGAIRKLDITGVSGGNTYDPTP